MNDVAPNLHFAKLYYFADDCKLLESIESVYDIYLSQCDINAIEKWCLENNMNFHLSKCSVISFNRKKEPIRYSY